MSRIAVIALIVWGVTVSAAAYFFVSGYTTEGSDGRAVVMLSTAERDGVLAEMRGLLEATADITAALARNDTAAIADIARPIGTAAMAGESPALLAKLPLPFKEDGLRVHTGFDALADAAIAGATTQDLTGLLSEHLLVCTGCHAAYRFGG
ncbi:hypothetical protein [Hoeflea sp.]|uniref:hypothetical protein n=1 Tax=Hoeflea sp. TaxID=1940281 RepID=UPI002AFFC4F2|nr:hypothetical protein [Hoeflea sp.]